MTTNEESPAEHEYWSTFRLAGRNCRSAGKTLGRLEERKQVHHPEPPEADQNERFGAFRWHRGILELQSWTWQLEAQERLWTGVVT